MMDYKKRPHEIYHLTNSHLDKCSSWGYTEKSSLNGDRWFSFIYRDLYKQFSNGSRIRK